MFVWVGAGKLLDRIYRIKKEQENEAGFGRIA
jgi:hypothetical protein